VIVSRMEHHPPQCRKLKSGMNGNLSPAEASLGRTYAVKKRYQGDGRGLGSREEVKWEHRAIRRDRKIARGTGVIFHTDALHQQGIFLLT